MHTKGEWIIETATYKHKLPSIHISGENGLVICMMGNTDHPSTEANAHLIVAAVNACLKVNPSNPTAVAENLEELMDWLEVVLRDFSEQGYVSAQAEAALFRIVPSIKKAKGE